MSLNLLPSHAKFQMEKIRAISLSRKILMWFLGVWVAVVILIIAIEQVESYWLKNLGEKYKVVMAQYLNSSVEIVTSQTIKFRAKLLGKVLADRFEYSDAFDLIGNLFDPQIKVKDFELKDKKYFLLTVSTTNSDLVKSIESRVAEINLGTEPKITKVVIKSVTFIKAMAEWQITLEVYLK